VTDSPRPAGSGPAPGGWFSVERPLGGIAAQLAALVVSRAVLLISTVLVARQVGLGAFGAFAVGLVVFQAGLFLRDAGLGQAIVILGGQEPGVARPAFLLVSAAGIGLAALMAVLADPLVQAIGVPEAVDAVRILALAFGIGSLGVVSNATLERMLRFRLRAGIDVAAYLALGATTIVLLQSGAGVVALAWGYVAQACVQAGLALILAPPRDSAAVSGGVRRLVRYSSLLWAAAALSYVASNLDNVLVARLGGQVALGLYALSYTLATTVTISLAQVLNRVALPYYGREGGAARAGQTLGSVVPLALALAAAPASLTVLLAPEIGRIALGPDASIAPLVVLAGYGVARAVGMSLGTALNGLGQAAVVVRGSALNVTFMAVAIPPLFILAGPTGTAAVVLIGMAVVTGYLLYRLRRDLHVRLGIASSIPLLAAWFTGAGLLVAADAPLPTRTLMGAVSVVVLLGWAARTIGLRAASWFPRSA
jgi:lipopolysaccharide exporter